MENNENRDELLESILSEIRETETQQLDPPAESATPAESAPSDESAPAEREGKQENPPAAKKKKKKGGGILTDLIALLLRIGWIALILSILLLVVCGITVNNGNRMAPAFHDRDVVIFYRLAKDIKAGEVVVFRGTNDQVVLARVVAKGGDTVFIDKDGLNVNGHYQTESYIRGENVLFEDGVARPVTLRQGEYFVLCDDRSQGGDSRTFGPVSEERILGRVMVSIRLRDF